MSMLQTTPYMLHDEEGQRLEALGALVVLKATSEQTGGGFNLFEVICDFGHGMMRRLWSMCGYLNVNGGTQ